MEQHFGYPVDIEWGLEDGRFALLQSRPIRGLDVANDVEVGRREEIERLKLLAGKGKVWVVHNLAETLPAPTPLTWDIIKGFMSGTGGYGRMYADFGFCSSKRVRDEGFLELICGRIYSDPDRAAEQFWESMPLRYDHAEILKDPRILEAAPTKFDAGQADEKFLFRLPSTLWAMLRSSRAMRRARRETIRVFEEQVLPPYRAYLAEKRQAGPLEARPRRDWSTNFTIGSAGFWPTLARSRSNRASSAAAHGPNSNGSLSNLWDRWKVCGFARC